MKNIFFKSQYKQSRILMLACIILCVFSLTLFTNVEKSWSKEEGNGKLCVCATCAPLIINCDKKACKCQSDADTPVTIKHITDEFIKHREWLIKILWEAHVLPAMMLMTEQISAIMMQQTMIIGTFFDAKHQLESQRLLQELQAQAHKDYHPSEGMCQFGTTTRSLAASERNAELTQIAIAARDLQRQLLNGDGIGSGSARDDSGSRLAQFKETYCNPADFGNGLSALCDSSQVARYNKDVNFTQTIDSPLTIELDFSKAQGTENEEDVLALSANLYGHDILPRIPEGHMAHKNGNKINEGAYAYMNTRALAAKRSVAQSAYAAQAAMKAQGEAKVQPYMVAILKNMMVDVSKDTGLEEEKIKEMLGERPSYHAQMELLTKKLYQYPNFYTDLYDKPVNIDRKNVSMQAIGLMQKRDVYRSLLRSEAIIAVWLETAVEDLEEYYVNETNPLKEGTQILELPGLNK